MTANVALLTFAYGILENSVFLGRLANLNATIAIKTTLNVSIQQMHYGLSQCCTTLTLLSQDVSNINQQLYFHNSIALSTAERLRVLDESVESLAQENKKLQKAASNENGHSDSEFAHLTGSISLEDVSNLHNLTSYLPHPPPPSPATQPK